MVTAAVDIRELWQRSAATVKATAAPSQTAGQALDIVRQWLKQRVDAAPPPTLDLALQQLAHLQLHSSISSIALDQLHRSFGEVEQLVDSHLEGYKTSRKDEHRLSHLVDLFSQLNALQLSLYHPIRPLESLLPGLPATWRQRFHTLLAAALPPTFGDALRFYFRQQYDTFIGEPESPFDFHDGHSLGIFDRFEPLLYSLVYEEIEYRINTVCKGDWSDEGILQQTREWLEDSVGAFVINIVKGGLGADVDKAAAEALLRSAFLRFDYHIHQTLLDLRIEELFEIIVEFPDSTPALKDIHACLAKVEGRTQLARHLVKANQRRLLHPGADTKDILDHYVSTIRALRIIDPPGVLLSIVAEPVRAYLRSREDTIRCIMNALMDESGGLEGELDRAASSAEMDASKEDEEDYRDPSLTWEPDPVDAPPDFHKSKGSDVVQMLISIYDTKDVFIREFQLLLAHRLMSIRDFNVTKEHRNVEILKRRFGEASLQACEVMLKDMADSKRIDQIIRGRRRGKGNEGRVSATIVSKLFWPAFQNAPFNITPQLAAFLRMHERDFTAAKPDKLIRWLHHLGTVSITVNLGDRALTVDALPMQHAVLELFTDKDIWTVDELVEQLGLNSVAPVMNALYFWGNHGVVGELVQGEWKLIEFAGPLPPPPPPQRLTIAPEELMQSTQSQQVEQVRAFDASCVFLYVLMHAQFRMYWQFVQGMLTNLGALPTDRIHTMLGRFLPAYKGHAEADMGAFLSAMQQEGKLDRLVSNEWKLTEAGKA